MYVLFNFMLYGSCRPVCCAHLNCNRYRTWKMVKTCKEYKSKDGELYFCTFHNPKMSDLYNKHKELVDWYPGKLVTENNITFEYKIWAIPQALELRRIFSEFCKPLNSPGHLHYEKLLLKQYIRLMDIVNAYSRTKRKKLMRRLAKKMPPKYIAAEESWDDVFKNLGEVGDNWE